MSLDAAIAITARLAEGNQLARRVYGANYEQIIRPYRETIQRLTVERGRPVAEACLHLFQVISTSGTEADMLCAMAAAYEEMASGERL